MFILRVESGIPLRADTPTYQPAHTTMLQKIRDALRKLKQRRRRRIYTAGRTLSRFIARDVRREVLVISAAEIDDGYITARIRTTNILYLSHGLTSAPPFGPAERVEIDRLWKWSGKSWGGLPDGTSLVKKADGASS
jgi:hypothetical protein